MPRGRPQKNLPAPSPAPIRHFFALVYPETKSISEEDVIRVKDELAKEIKDNPTNTRIDLIIHSWGGDVYSAFKIITIIRGYCNELNVIIPIRAVSAGTLIALGADTIYMDKTSQLGPLDLPTEHPTMEGTKVSAIDCVQSIAYLEGILKSTALNRYAELKELVGLGKKDAISLAYDIAVKFTQPLVSKLDPIQTSKSSRELEIASIYGEELLSKFMFKTHPHPLIDSENTITKLVYSYPAHGFAVCFNEALKIGLNVKKAEEYTDWKKVWMFTKKAGSKRTKYIWHLTDDELNTWQ